MKAIFTEFAANEFREAQSFYELEVKDLGKEFKKELIILVKRILKYPEAYPVLHGEVRKCVIRKFPFNLFYSIEDDFILILSVAHQHRKPFYWADN